MAEADPPATDLDIRLMGVALRLGRRNLGRTFPNPAVGALVVKTEGGATRVVGAGWTAIGGRPHAEAVALDEAGEDAQGATVYVTLEPCSHFGETPPCANALVRAGVARVVTAMSDPDPRVSGRGHAILRNAGIRLTTGVLERDARAAHAGHILRVTEGRPHVTLKLAVSADGMIGRRDGERMIISGPEAFERVHAMRAESDCVMIGIGTALADDPRLTVRLPGLSSRSPIRVVMDKAARLSPQSKLAAAAREIPLWIVVGVEAPADRRQALAEAGAVIIKVEDGQRGLDMGAALAALGERGLTRVLAEGGSQVASSLILGGLADEVVFFRAAVVVGPEGVRAFAGQALSAVERSPRYVLAEDGVIGADRLRRYLRAA